MAAQTTNENGRILVVDDYPMNRLKLARVLEQQGHTVSLAEDGRQALTLLRAEPFDVVLLDIVMPEMDGHQVLEIMKSDNHLREIPVIVISAVDEVESAVRCIEMGAEDYIAKPFNPVFLKARLSASLRRKKLRDLEKAYLQQEITLRQSEKLATLGRLSAGMAHELNNPAAAVSRGVAQLQQTFAQHVAAHLALDRAALSAEQAACLQALDELAQNQANRSDALDSLVRSDHESDLEEWFDAQGIADGWQFTADLVSLGYGPEETETLLAAFGAEQATAVLEWFTTAFTIHSILREMGEGAGRMTEIVKALKTYTYLDQAPVQNVNVHEGLDNTLVMLRSKLKHGITVHRQYAADLPRIEAYGSELNQVWTNIIDNAIAAMQGEGDITIHTYQDGGWVVVEISDSGPGIPEAIQSQIFDPFFTTKPPGEGTGLGLNISHTIITQKHKGQLTVATRPGYTCFQARLPLQLANKETV
ncbi:MAG: response regulator [Ardenticatenaceae bacterium]|nr:response regulator [Ardenticatenaceae bacterium]